MIAGKDIFEILAQIIPMYFTLSMAYTSVKWLKLFSLEQCAGINRFLRVFAIPLLCFKLISSNNFYAMNYKLFGADCLQKFSILISLFLWEKFSKNGNLDWMITFFSLSSLPNTMIIGLPIVKAMYGDEAVGLMVQTLVFQGVIWINVLLVLLECRAAKILVSEKFSGGGCPPVKEVEAMVSGDWEVRVESNLSGVDVNSVKSSTESRFSNLKMGDLNGFSHVFPENDGSATPATNSVDFEDETTIGNVIENKDLHMFVGNSSTESSSTVVNGNFQQKQQEPGNPGADSTHFDTWKNTDLQSDTFSIAAEGNPERKKNLKAKFVLLMVWKKFTRNPNTYSSLFGVVWSLISFKYHIRMPTVVSRCLSMFSDTGMALAIFSLGTFMAAQPKMIGCSRWEAIYAMVARFLLSPALMAATSLLVGLRGVALHTAIMQAAFPQAILSFVFAKEYNVHPNVLSTSVALGMLIALPVVLLYYFLLGSILT